MNQNPNSLCPRCRSSNILVHSTSPVPGTWTVYGCSVCMYAWRSTEPVDNTDPEHYPKAFRLTAADLAKFEAVPPVA